MNKRHSKFIVLLCDNRDFKPMSFYASLLSVTTRTISNYIKVINENISLKKMWIETLPNRGIKLIGEEQDVKNLRNEHSGTLFEDYYITYFEELTEIIRIIVFERQVTNYETLSFQLLVSTSIVKRLIDFLKKFENTDCIILGDYRGTRIVGSEIGIQNFINSFYLKMFSEHSQKLSLTLKEITQIFFDEKVVTQVFEIFENIDNSYDISENYYHSLIISLITFLGRRTSGLVIDDDFETSVPSINKLITEKNDFYSKIKSVSKKEYLIEFADYELCYLKEILYVHKAISNTSVHLDNKEIKNSVRKFIKDISLCLNINFEENDKLFNSLYSHIEPMIQRAKSNIIIRNPLLEDIKVNFPILMNLVWLNLRPLELEYDVIFSEDEVSYITVHLQLMVESNKQLRKVALVCETGSITSTVLKKRIEGVLPVSINFVLVSLKDLQKMCLENIDFIITTLDIYCERVPTVKISPLVSEQDLVSIYSYYLKYSRSEVAAIKESNQHSSVLHDMLNIKNIIIVNSIESKEDCIKILTHKMLKNNEVYSDFKQDVLNREKLGSTYIYSGISIPHAASSNVIKNTIGVLVVKDGVKWDGHNVNIVFLMAMKEENVSEISSELPQLYKKIFRTEFVNETIKIKNAQDVYRTLLK